MWKIGSLLAIAIIGCSAGRDDAFDAAGSQISTAAGTIVPIQYEVQKTSFWCGPAATRIALSAQPVVVPTQRELATDLQTDEDGTDWIGQVTEVLNKRLGPNRYKTVELLLDPPTAPQKEQLWKDIVYSIDHNYPVVTNIWAPANNHPPGYPDRLVKHYFTVIGYDAETSRVFIADPASFSGQQQYWLSFAQLATLIPPKGYSALSQLDEPPPDEPPAAN